MYSSNKDGCHRGQLLWRHLVVQSFQWATLLCKTEYWENNKAARRHEGMCLMEVDLVLRIKALI